MTEHEEKANGSIKIGRNAGTGVNSNSIAIGSGPPPEEKAKELVEKFAVYSDAVYNVSKDSYDDPEYSNAIQCALIAVEEIIKTHSHREIIGLGGYDSEWTIEYWEKVKQAIIALNNGN